MKECHNSLSVGVKRKQHRHFISGWIWPYIIIPACVAALLAIFFLILGPILLHQIGIKYSLEFWLIALGVWAFVTGMCTLVWMYAGRHLIPTSYYTVVGQEIVQQKQKEDGYGTVYKYTENGNYNQEKSDQDQSNINFSDQLVVYKHGRPSEPSPPQDLLDGFQKTEVDDENSERRNSLEEDKKLLSSQIIESYPEKSREPEAIVIQIKEHLVTPAEDNELIIPELQPGHSPRRVSYAGVISVNIPPSEEIKIENVDRNTLHAPRPPTPRFPRGMRVASNDSSVSAQLADLYLNNSLPKDSQSKAVEITHPLDPKEKVASIEKAEVHQKETEQDNCSSSDSEESGHSLTGQLFTFENTPQSPKHEGNFVKSYTLETSVVKKVRLSERTERIDNIDARPKRMSLDRNQFLGWNPEKGVLEEADPGSKEREERRWKRSIGAWRGSTSTSHDNEIMERQENTEEEDDDDVFHDVSDKIPESQTQVSQIVTITKAEIHSTSV